MTPKLQRTSMLASDGVTMLPHAVCLCGKTVMVRADGRTLYTHKADRSGQCPMSRQPFEYQD